MHQFHILVSFIAINPSLSASIPRPRVETSGITGQQDAPTEHQFQYEYFASRQCRHVQCHDAGNAEFQQLQRQVRLRSRLDASTTLISRSASPLEYSDRRFAHRARSAMRWWSEIGAGQVHQRDLMIGGGELPSLRSTVTPAQLPTR